jgi:DNA-binding XRE family transcriptional regulator
VRARQLYSAADVKRVRRANLLSQDEFAEVFGVSRRTVIRWEQHGVDWRAYGFSVPKFCDLEQLKLPL